MPVSYLFIDGDLFVYRVAHACKDEPIEKAMMTMDRMLGAVLMRYPEVPYSVYLSGSSAENYRHKFAVTAPYKGNRTDVERPAHYDALRSYLMDNYGCSMSQGNEADDTVSIDYTTAWEAYLSVLTNNGRPPPCIVSVDKDFDQLEGLRYDFVKEEEVWKTSQEAMQNLYRQVLEGDTADNVIGVDGVGPVWANLMLDNCTTPKQMFDRCIDVWMVEEDVDYDTARKRVIENLNLVFLQRIEGEYYKVPEQ